MTNKQKAAMERRFEDATPEQLGEALAAAQHVLIGNPSDDESRIVKEYIESQDLDPKDAKQIKLPDKIQVTCKKKCHVDGVPFNPGQSAEITLKQYHALSRFFTKLAAIAALLFLVNLTAQAQTYQINALGSSSATAVQTLNGTTVTGAYSINGGTNVIAASANNSYAAPIVLTKWGYVAIEPVFKLMAAGTSAVTFTINQSEDGTNFVQLGQFAVTAAGTTTVTGLTNYTLFAPGYLTVNVANGNTAIVTNLQILYSRKTSLTGN